MLFFRIRELRQTAKLTSMDIWCSKVGSVNVCRADCVNSTFSPAGANSLAYLSIDGLVKAVRQGIVLKNNIPTGHCTACLDGNYPVHLEW